MGCDFAGKRRKVMAKKMKGDTIASAEKKIFPYSTIRIVKIEWNLLPVVD